MPLPPNAELVLRKAITAHRELYNLIATIKQSVSEESECEQLADIAVALREAETHLEDTRKTVTNAKEVVCRLACMRYLEDASRVLQGEPIRTDLVTANPEMTICAKIPTYEKDPVAYAKMMTYLGVDEQLWDKGKILTDAGEQHTEVVRVHWPGFQSLCTRLKAHGLPLPDGIDENATFTQFTLHMRKKGPLLSKSFDEDDATQSLTNAAKVPDSEIPF